LTGKYRFHVVAYDFGVKRNSLRLLACRGCRVTVVPATTSASKVLELKPDGVFLSNGPGDPAAVTYAIDAVRQLLGRVPIFGICLGQQLLGLALGAQTYKLKFGHRGSNQPVKNLATGSTEITTHNHGFSVRGDTLPEGVELTHVNLNDQCVEGLRVRDKRALSVQFHPEAAPGPHDAVNLFNEFIALMEAARA
jgi:carbamoyl-phosphate synthase small subunit